MKLPEIIDTMQSIVDALRKLHSLTGEVPAFNSKAPESAVRYCRKCETTNHYYVSSLDGFTAAVPVCKSCGCFTPDNHGGYYQSNGFWVPK